MNNTYVRFDLYSHGYFKPLSTSWRIVGVRALMGTLRKEAIVGATFCQLKIHIFKALVLPTYT